MNDKVKKLFYKRWRFVVLCVVVALGVVSSLGCSPNADPVSSSSVSSSAPSASSSSTTSVSSESPASPSPEQSSQPNSEAITIGQKNALAKAKEYLAFAAFSHKGLIEQLEYEKFSHEDSVYGADNCDADWNEQAAKKAKEYLDMTAFSRDSLIEQLEFEGFTNEQAVYGVEANGY